MEFNSGFKGLKSRFVTG